MRSLQVSAAEVSAGVCVRAVFPAGSAAEVRQRAQGVRGEQRDEAAERAAAAPAGGRRELASVRGGHAAARPRLRLRRRHLAPPAPATPAADGPQLRQIGALQVPKPPRSRLHHPQPHRGRRRRRRSSSPSPPPPATEQPGVQLDGRRRWRRRQRRRTRAPPTSILP